MAAYTDFEIQDAILKAADQIERHPNSYNFMQGIVRPAVSDPNTRMCALAWVGHFLHMHNAATYMDVGRVLGISPALNEDPFFSSYDSDKSCDIPFHVVEYLREELAPRYSPKQ